MRTTSALGLALALGLTVPVLAAGDAMPPKEAEWSFDGPFGTYDRAALQRGFQVYKEVCAACHGLKRVAFSALDDPGGPGFTEAEMKAIAAGYRIPADPNDQGEIFDENGERLTRPGIPADRFPDPYPNENAARANNNGALPPDLSVIVKARLGGPDYVYSLLTGYQDPPAGVTMRAGMNYNPYFSGGQIAMAQPLFPNSVTYADGTEPTVGQMAHDVVTFLSWAAEPKMEARKRLGFQAMLYLALFAGLLYLAYRRIWSGLH